MTLEIGHKIGQYEILELLGAGGMGEVYRARDLQLDRDVAIKLLSPSVANDPEARQRFKREAKATAAVVDPNIATIHAIEETDGHFYIVLEYVKGRDLRALIQEKELSATQIVEYALQAARGLATAHRQGIIHRDVKSANILVNESGVVKITDFGLAAASGNTRITQPGSAVGTISFMSPEQIQGCEVDGRADLWSLGVVLYEMITRELPFRGDNPAALMYSVLNDEPAPTESIRPDIPEHVARLVRSLLSKCLDDRPANASAVVAALEQTVAEPSAVAEPGARSIAVLFFENISAEKENDYFCAGITEDLIIDLSRVGDIRVTPRSEVMPFRGRDLNRQTVGRQLNVAYVLDGSVRKAGQRIRITAQLFEVSTGFSIWAERYDRTIEDIFDIQADVSQQIVEAMKVSLSDAEKSKIGGRGTQNLQAYDFYMRGRDFFHEGGSQNNSSAMKMLEVAVQTDPNFTSAWIALGEAYFYALMFYDGSEDWFDKSMAAYGRALVLEPDNIEARVGVAFGHYHNDNLEEAIRGFQDVVRERPGNYVARKWLGASYMIQKKPEKALEHMIALTEIHPGNEESWLHLAQVANLLGDDALLEKANKKKIETARAKLEINPGEPLVLSRLIGSLVEVGEVEEARERLEEFAAREHTEGLVLYNIASAYALLDDRELMLKFLRKAFDRGYNRRLANWVRQDTDFKSFKDDPEFIALLDSAENASL